MEFLQGFIDFILSFVKYIQELVKYIRKKNDGDDSATQPAFPSIGG
ncbi:MAG: hypothetical protein IJK02_11135 [Clostridia bacterium]|nr:hypothetical protein [Clostridia bacterium]MBR0508640.1 hypothetical protein [Clostridia bacterium]MBR0537279.1 hypothetical protein [Clostridia bacterium]